MLIMDRPSSKHSLGDFYFFLLSKKKKKKKNFLITCKLMKEYDLLSLAEFPTQSAPLGKKKKQLIMMLAM